MVIGRQALGRTGQALGPVTLREGRIMGEDRVTALGSPVLTAGGIHVRDQ
ncbi:MAG: hypothetical protein U0871_03985 [Gemmataceae bacterium]